MVICSPLIKVYLSDKNNCWQNNVNLPAAGGAKPGSVETVESVAQQGHAAFVHQVSFADEKFP